MEIENEENVPDYVNEAVLAVERIVAENKYGVLERLMRLTKGEVLVLKILIQSGTSISPTELSEIMNSSKGRISAILNSLEKKGEIIREIDKDNRRNIIVNITESDRKHIISELADGYSIIAKALEKMGEEDTKELIRLMNKSFSILKELETDSK